jgi:RND family efflux transporter MFP subunit
MIKGLSVKSWPAVLGGAALLSLLAGCGKPPAPPAQGPLPVNVVTAIEKEVVEWDEFTGRIEAVESVEIRSRVNGYLQEIHFKAGAIVQKGDLLFVIDPRPYQADLDRTAAILEQMQAQLKLAQIDFTRAKDLRDKKVTSPEEFDQKSATLQQAQAGVRSAQAAKDSAALNLEFTQIRSPIAGRVSNERVTVGNLVQAGAGDESILTTVVSTDPLYVYIDADENSILKYIKLSAEGKRVSARNKPMPAFIQLGNEENFPHEGIVDFVDNRLDPDTATLRARGLFKNWDPLVTPGFFVRVRIPGREKYVATQVNDKVISSEQGQKYVYVVKPDHTVERRNIKTGTISEGLRIVHEGLKAGEQVVSTRLQILQPGMKVNPIPEAPPATTPAPVKPQTEPQPEEAPPK